MNALNRIPLFELPVCREERISKCLFAFFILYLFLPPAPSIQMIPSGAGLSNTIHETQKNSAHLVYRDNRILTGPSPSIVLYKSEYCMISDREAPGCEITQYSIIPRQRAALFASRQYGWSQIFFLCAMLTGALGWYRKKTGKIAGNRRASENLADEKSQLAEALKNALSEIERLKNQLQAENLCLQEEIKIQHNFETIITQSESLIKVLRNVEKVASTNATVLILGESGTGKELLARAIHRISQRNDHSLVKVNCSALPANLIESELFGHEKGAFTGAILRKIGRFELAHNGTIFLDEIGDLPLELQAKLLRVLQEGEFERLGNAKTIKVDARVIAATNRNLEEAIEAGTFRRDLFYRLNVFPIRIPPLRERMDDIPLLVKHFVQKHSKRIGKEIQGISQSALRSLHHYHWPGNVRELENVIERAVIISNGKQLVLGDWMIKNSGRVSTSFIPTLEELEKNHILSVLEMTGGRVSGDQGAAKILGINPKTLESRMKKLDINKKKTKIS